jgi:hypothetical protein
MTMGAELADPGRTTFAALVASHFGLDLFNAGYGGGSNDRILRTTLMWLSEYFQDGGKPDDLFVLIGWTGPDRREVGLSEEEGTLNPNFFWRNVHMYSRLADSTPDLDQLRKIIIRSFWSDRESMTRFLVAANALQGVLASYGIRYLFVHSVPACPVHPELAAIAGSINAGRFFRFLEPQGDFFSLSRDVWRVPMGPSQHPLEEGHLHWSGLLIEHIIQSGML